MKIKRALPVLGLILALALGLGLAVEAEVNKPSQCVDKELCAEKLRFGTEAFTRGKYSQAKVFFREAVQADPANQRAWSYYDLTIMYDVAEQVKRTGTVKLSGAPAPGSAPWTDKTPTPAPAGSGTETPPPAPAPAQKGGIVIDDEGC